MVRSDDGAVDHLNLIRQRTAVVQRVKDHLPEAGERPAPELAIDRAPFAELFLQVPPRRTGTGDSEHAIQNTAMIHCANSVVGQHFENECSSHPSVADLS